jgi:hypothetical protein
MTTPEVQVLARKLLVYLICGVAAGGAAACYTWLRGPSAYIVGSLLIGMAINAVFDYGMRVGREGKR